jgi:hypothetical protein
MNENQQNLPADEQSNVYPGGNMFPGSPTHRGTNDIVAALSQMVGKDQFTGQPEAIAAMAGAMATVRGLYNIPGEHFIYYVRDNDVSSSPLFSANSQGRVKKIVTFPLGVEESTIIRATVFTYQNPTYPTSVTSISEYEEQAGFYMVSGSLSYDVNSVNQNRIVPNTP